MQHKTKRNVIEVYTKLHYGYAKNIGSIDNT